MSTYLQWNITNWITVLLMAVIGLAVVGFATSFLRGGDAGDDADA